MGAEDDSRARLLLDDGADPNARASFPPEATFHSEAPDEPLHDVTPVGYARRYPDRRCVNAPAIAATMSIRSTNPTRRLKPAAQASGASVSTPVGNQYGTTIRW